MTTNQENLKELLQKAKYKSKKRVGNKWVYIYDEPKGKNESKSNDMNIDSLKNKVKEMSNDYLFPSEAVIKIGGLYYHSLGSGIVSSKSDIVQKRPELKVYTPDEFIKEAMHKKEFGLSKATDNLKDILKADKSVKSAMKHPDKPGAGAKKRKDLKNPQDKVSAVMSEFKRGTLRDSAGKVVTDIKQAQAIAMSEAGLSKAQTSLSCLLKADRF